MEAVDHDPTVFEWKRDLLISLGINRVVACEYAEGLDVHQVEALIRRGCPPELALEIVR